MDYEKFSDIRPLSPSEVPGAIQELLANQMLRAVYEQLGTSTTWEALGCLLEGCDSVDEFKRRVSYHLVKHVMQLTCSGVSLHGTEVLASERGYTYISNHRDIILDSAFINVLLYDAGQKFPQVAIGDNLMLFPWVETLVKLNGSFLVRRSLQGREVLLAAKKLSEYMHAAASEDISTWIAQREGRAKDSSDHTQPALLKMLALGAGKRDIVEALLPLNIVPVCCSYEYDPCDYLKAREMQLKRDCPDYTKTKEEDGLNMRTGVFGHKGRVHIQVARPLNEVLARTDWSSVPDAGRVEYVADLLDREIHRSYRLFPGNYVALDLIEGKGAWQSQYTEEERATFEAYVQSRLDKITLPEGLVPDTAFLRARILEMYANPVINYTKASAECHEL